MYALLRIFAIQTWPSLEGLCMIVLLTRVQKRIFDLKQHQVAKRLFIRSRWEGKEPIRVITQS